MSYAFAIIMMDGVSAPAKKMMQAMGLAEDQANDLKDEVEKVSKSTNNMLKSFGKAFAGGVFLDRLGRVATGLADMNDRMALSNTLIRQIAGSDDALMQANRAAGELSAQAGISILEANEGIAKLLPLANRSVDRAADLAKLAAALSKTNPAEGFEGALFALKELESGDTMSLRERFNIRVPTQSEAKKIAERDGRTIQEVMFGELNQYLDETFGGGQQGAGINFLLGVDENTISGQWRRISSSIMSALTPVLMSVLPSVTKSLQNINKWVNENIETIKKWLPPILAVTAGIAAMVAVGSTISIIGTALGGLLSPIGLVVIGVGALAGGVIYLWNQFEGVRGAIVGVWESLKKLGELVRNRFVDSFKSVGKILKGVFTLDFSLIKEGLREEITSYKKDVIGAGAQLGEAFRTGYDKGVAMKSVAAPQSLLDVFKQGQQANGAAALAALGAGGGNSATTSKAAAKAMADVRGDAREIKNITINIDALNKGGVTVQTTTLGMAEQQVKDFFTRLLLSVANDVNYQ